MATRTTVAALACVLWAALHGYPQGQSALLPRPGLSVPGLPPLVPTVITAGGQRRLLSDSVVEVRYEAQRKHLAVNRPDWWVINYPLTRIKGFEGKSADDIAQQLFGKPAHLVRNWYLKTPGEPGPEPPAAAGPAPIELTPNPALLVNAQHPKAHDGNPGTVGAPLKTIAAALKRAKAGTVIHVYPGTYRESPKIEQSGTAAQPIRLEGVRDRTGGMPVISGNDPFPANAWKPVTGLVRVYRADLFSEQLGTLSADGRTLIERGLPAGLKPGEFCLNHASKEFLNLRLDGTVNPREGDRQDGKPWRRLQTDAGGFLDVSTAYREQARRAVFWASTFLWVEPRPKKAARNPDSPETITGRLAVEGGFRAGRITGASLSGQANTYRVWVNGQLLPSVIYSTEQDFQLRLPHPSRSPGDADRWDNFPLQEGWNHLVFQLDTTSRPEQTRFRFTLPKGIDAVVTSATKPPARDKPTEAPPLPYVSEYLVLGPFPASQDLGVYVRLPGDADPNTVTMDLAARANALVGVRGDFVQVRGFEIRHGAQAQQRAQVDLRGEGLLLEGNLIRDSEVGGIRFATAKDQGAAPIVIRNNWVVNPGHLGIGGGGSSDRLTPENQNDLAPGRGPVLIEHNTVINSNWAGYSPGWEAGGMKVFRLTGAVIRYNTVIGGSGPGIWLDWEHYGNRVEGNLLRSVFGYGIGVEASPGPNVIANNLLIHVRPGWEWFRAAILAWDSDRTWAVNNTVDGGWNPTVWERTVGTIGINLREGGNRRTRWGPSLDAQQIYINNLVVGSPAAMSPRERDHAEANFTDRGTGAESAEVAFRNAGREDYRLVPQSPLRKRGVDDEVTRLVGHDFYGLPRFPDDGRSVGAIRREPVPKPNSGSLVEVEFHDGELRRLYEIVP
jgi:Right handed beta helix region/Protein of unknown function (DUF1565)